MRKFTIPETQIVVQPEIKASGTEVVVSSVMDDGGCVMASWTFAGKNFNEVLWDENTTPSYASVGVWSDADVDARIIEILNQK